MIDRVMLPEAAAGCGARAAGGAATDSGLGSGGDTLVGVGAGGEEKSRFFFAVRAGFSATAGAAVAAAGATTGAAAAFANAGCAGGNSAAAGVEVAGAPKLNPPNPKWQRGMLHHRTRKQAPLHLPASSLHLVCVQRES